MSIGILSEPTLVGRGHELAELTHFLDLAALGKGLTVFVTGEAGSGKTRLASDFLNIVKKRGIQILTGRCLSDAAVPYLPFIEAFNSFFGALNDEEEPITQRKTEISLNPAETSRVLGKESGITAWLTGVKPVDKLSKLQTLSPQIWQDQVFDGVVKTLQTISITQPIVLFIEDLHWADSASLALLHYVARSINNKEKILTLATFRSEELTADVEGHPHPLTETLRAMRRQNLFSEIRLPNLSKIEINKMAENMIGGNLECEFAEKLVAESRGNPLFVVESLRMLIERKGLILENNTWRLAVDEIGIPSKIEDIILARLAKLKYPQRRILDAASVIGEKFNLELLSTVLGLDTLEVIETLNVIMHSTSIVNAEEDSYKFDHAKSRETLYEQLSSPLKKGYHSRIAETLETASKSDKLPLNEIAHHYAEAGNREKAVKFALAAGQDALEHFSNTEAIKHLSYVLERISDVPANNESKRIAIEALGDAYYANCMYKKALTMFEHLADSETGAVKLRAYRKAMDAVIFGMIDFPHRLTELAKKAEPYAASNRLENARIRFLGATALSGMRGFEEFKGTLRVFEEEYSLPDVARALIPLAMAKSHSKVIPSAIETTFPFRRFAPNDFLRSIAMHEEIGDLRGLLDALFYAGQTFWFCGAPIQEAQKMLERTIQIGEKLGHYSRLANARLYLGTMAEHIGHFEKAITHGQKASEYFALTDHTQVYNQIGYAFLARQYVKLGNLKCAEEYFSKIANLPPTLQYGTSYLTLSANATIIMTQGIMLATQNNWKEADLCFKKAIEIARQAFPMQELFVRNEYVRVLNLQGLTAESKAQLKEIEKIKGEVEEAFAHVSVEASLMAPRLVTAGEEFEMRLDLVNASNKKGKIVKIEGIVMPEFAIVTPPVIGNLQNTSIEFCDKGIDAFQVITIKLRLRAQRTKVFSLDPVVTYADDLGEIKICKPDSVTMTVQPAKPAFEVLPNRISTGYDGLDALLLGGIPENYAVVLASPACDEKELIVKRFLEAGVAGDGISFHLTAEAANTKMLAITYLSNFYLFLCNSQADAMVQSSLNVFKLKGVENLTEIDIALAKALRTLKSQTVVSKRICVDVMSDVLLQHHAVTTRKWLGGLLAVLKSEGFTTLAVLNSGMHSREELQAVLGLFEGEMQIFERETGQGIEKVLRIRRLYNQKYLNVDLILVEEKTE